MHSETTIVATRYRLQEWAAQIKDCQNRPADMRVDDWCSRNGITKATYYYRLRRVRAACLETFPKELPANQIVPVDRSLLRPNEPSDVQHPSGLSISCRECTIHITQATPMHLLTSVLEVLRHAE